MLNLANYSSIGAALKDAMQRFADEVCLIEADREREKERITYREFNARALPLARARIFSVKVIRAGTIHTARGRGKRNVGGRL